MSAALPPELLRRASHAVEVQLGLCYPAERWDDLERGLRAAAPELGLRGARECAERLAAESFEKESLETLAANLTIGETYFFREPRAFELLETEVLPEVARRGNAGGARRLRIWSAGCCTGEEAYSIALVLRRTWHRLADWPASVLATDVNPRFLRRASEGVYRQWSFRGAPELARSRFFHEVAPGEFAVEPEVKKLVTFRALNLVEDVFPSLATGTVAMDVIFCRNVLMYFSRAQASRVMQGFHATLTEGGWFFSSAGEGTEEFCAPLLRAKLSGAAIFRKTKPSTAAEPPPVARPHASAPRPKRHPAPVRQKIEHGDPHALASQGRWSEALAACDAALAADKLHAASHYLRGAILQEQGAPAQAIEALRRALYLDPGLVVAHFTLGALLEGQGRSAEAARSFQNAATLLGRCPAETVLPESDGITAGRMLVMLESRKTNR